MYTKYSIFLFGGLAIVYEEKLECRIWEFLSLLPTVKYKIFIQTFRGMKQKQVSIVLFIIGILLALISAILIFFGIAPLPLGITVLIVGIGLIATASPIARAKK